MENNLQYSIIYADIRPEIKERLSLGVLTIEQNKVKVYYSQKKLGLSSCFIRLRSIRLYPLLSAKSCASWRQLKR